MIQIQSKCIRFLIIFFTFIFYIVGGAVFAEETAADDLKLLTEDLAEISERLDKVETKSILDRVTIGGEFRTRLDYFKYEDTIASGQEDDAELPEIWSNRLRLNLKAEITENLIFHGRLSYFKLWGTTNYAPGIEASLDFLTPSIPDAEGDVHVERAYIDYFISGTPLSFTVGRLPTGEGPPNELKDNTTRKGTWSKVLVDGEFDGIFANLYLEEWTGLKKSLFRVMYTKIFQNYLKDTGIDVKDLWAGAFTFEMEVPGVKDSLFWVNYSPVRNIAFDINLEDLGLPSSLSIDPVDLGDCDIFNFYLDFKNIRGSGLDWFGSASYIEIKTTSNHMLTMGIFSDMASGNLGKDRSGSTIFTGLRYRLPVSELKFPKIGFEYFHGSKHWLPLLSGGSGDMVNILSVNGDAYELYYIQPIIEKYMFLRAGWIYIDYDYYNQTWSFGTQQESDMKLTNAYLLMDVKF